MKNLDALIRPQVKGFEPYLPGRSIESIQRERKLSRIIKLASNENPLGPSPKALVAMRNAASKLFLYPDGASVALRTALAKKGRVPVERVIVGAGSDELIELFGKTYLNPGDSIVVSEHAFLRYKMAGDLMGAEVISVPMRDFTHNLEAMGNAIRENTKLLFIANPNNPTGTFNTQLELETLLKKVAQLNARRRFPVLVIVDEAYYEYARAFEHEYPDTLSLQKAYGNLVTLRTFSKAHALAGLRVGYGYADPEVISALDRVRPPFNVSVLGQVGAEASLKDEVRVQKAIRHVRVERQKVLQEIGLLGLSITPSAGNFVLIGISPRKGKDVFESLLSRGIIVRSMDEYGYPNHIRVTYGLAAENKAFITALKAVMA